MPRCYSYWGIGPSSSLPTILSFFQKQKGETAVLPALPFFHHQFRFETSFRKRARAWRMAEERYASGESNSPRFVLIGLGKSGAAETKVFSNTRVVTVICLPRVVIVITTKSGSVTR